MFVLIGNTCINCKIIKTIKIDKFESDDGDVKYLILCSTEEKDYVASYDNEEERSIEFYEICKYLCSKQGGM